MLSKILDWTDRSTLVLFGDGAGAVVMEHVDEGGFLGFELGADGGGGEHALAARQRLAALRGRRQAREDERPRGVQVRDARARLVGREGPRRVRPTVDDVDVYVPHQANVRIIDHAARKLGIPEEKVVVNVDRYGNTSSGSIPLALADAAADGRLREGELVLMTGMGAGLTWGSALIEWTNGEGSVTQDRLHVPWPGLVRGRHGTRDRRGGARGDGGVRGRQRGGGDRPRSRSASTARSRRCSTPKVQQPALVATSLAINAGDPLARDRAGLRRRPLGRRVRRAGRRRVARHRRRDRARARARARDGGGARAAPGLDGGDPRPRRRGRRGPLQAGSTTSGRRTTTAPGQIVISGEDDAVGECCTEAEREGARRAVRLRVSGAFHSPLVARAADRLRPAVEQDPLPRPARRRSCRR